MVSKIVIPPVKPGVSSLSQIQLSLARPVRNVYTVEVDGTRYIHYRTLLLILDRYAPGWSWEICNRSVLQGTLWITGRLTIVASDGVFYREAITQRSPLEGEPIDTMALRASAAMFGLSL